MSKSAGPWTPERYAQKNANRRQSRGEPNSRTRREYRSGRYDRQANTRNGAFGTTSSGIWNRYINGTTGQPRGSGQTDEEN